MSNSNNLLAPQEDPQHSSYNLLLIFNHHLAYLQFFNQFYTPQPILPD
jgi:hypothetical protein